MEDDHVDIVSEEVLYKYNLLLAEKIIKGVLRENCSFKQLPDRIRYHAVEGMTSYE